MTKEAGHTVLVSETTAKWLAGEGTGGLRYVGELDVRGRAAGVRVWTFDDAGNDSGPRPGGDEGRGAQEPGGSV
jgi:hypothetical protein